MKTYLVRLINKDVNILRFVKKKIGQKLLLSGARTLGFLENGNAVITLNKKSLLGVKGQEIELPVDEVIYEYLLLNGTWELSESNFLANSLIGISAAGTQKIAFLDIGAYCGLITLQTMNAFKGHCEIFLIEPVESHVKALKKNMKNLVGKHHLHILPYGLADTSRSARIITQKSNHGNSSLFENLVPVQEREISIIELKATSNFCYQNLLEFENIVLKIDTQGMDAHILSRFPQRIWDKVGAAVVEVWATEQIDQTDVINFISMIKTFSWVNFKPTGRSSISMKDLEEFWLSGSGESRNLYISR